MGLNRLSAFLGRHRVVALDTSIFIYEVESNARYVSLTDLIFEWLERPESRAVTSAITMTELLVHPYRNCSEQEVAQYYALLSTYPNLSWIEASLAIADIAASIRAIHGLRTPDAIKAATAVNTRATGLITNDAVCERVEAFETLVLDKLL